MKNFNEIQQIISRQKPVLRGKHKVEQLGVFGSIVRDEQTKSSDIDVLVDFSEPVGMFEFLDLEEYLENLLGTKVDLVTRNALKPRIGEQILAEVKYL